MIYSAIGGGLVFFACLLWWLWRMHCFFFFHQWDKSRLMSDVCLRCGAFRFTDPVKKLTVRATAKLNQGERQ